MKQNKYNNHFGFPSLRTCLLSAAFFCVTHFSNVCARVISSTTFLCALIISIVQLQKLLHSVTRSFLIGPNGIMKMPTKHFIRAERREKKKRAKIKSRLNQKLQIPSRIIRCTAIRFWCKRH